MSAADFESEKGPTDKRREKISTFNHMTAGELIDKLMPANRLMRGGQASSLYLPLPLVFIIVSVGRFQREGGVGGCGLPSHMRRRVDV
ncbi:hypothetical protein CDAR_436571 [Caerostris darwini]|uniref:Uncharacterized protein n=1 Tax=Caerostris darwini TaxID=1538125 RepID=A0AAV4SE78_9ARAC|nr:hypothetical protein CDAR_436571 [Caerostris darwini]